MVGHRHLRRKQIMRAILATDPNIGQVELWELKGEDGFRLMERQGGRPIGEGQRDFLFSMDPRIRNVIGGNVIVFNQGKITMFNSDPDDFNTTEVQAGHPYDAPGCWIPLGNMSGGRMEVTHMVAMEGAIDPSGSRENDQMNFLVAMSRLIQKELYSQRDEEIGKIDPLTNLWNRRFLNEVLLKMAVASIIRKRRFAVGFIDLDDFKRLNDTYGHSTADEMMGIIGSRLRSEAGGFASRYGGEEFVLLSPGVATLSDLERHGAYLHSLFNPMLCSTECGPVEARASIGVAGSSIWQELREVKRFPSDFKEKMMDAVRERIDKMKQLREQCDADLKRIRRQRKMPQSVDGPLQEYARNWGELLISLADMAMYAVKLMGKNGVAMPYAKNGELSFHPLS